LTEELEGIGDRLRDERTKAGISQRELARRLGLSPSLISQLESGLSKPSVGTLYAIVTELDLSLDKLLRGADHSPSTSPPGGKAGVANGGLSPLVHPDDRDRNPDILRKLANISGGEYFHIPDLKDIVPACKKIATDIRNRYTLAYIPQTAASRDSTHVIKVSGTDPSNKRLIVRTRTRYRMPEAPK
jgi:transcriptional regulator with XRE-family HTH domain